MSYIQQSLSKNESIHKLFEFHGLAYLPVFLLILPVFTMPLALYMWLGMRFTEQGVTTKRVILKKGIISRKSEEINLNNVETVEIKQGIIGRIFGYGNVKITGTGNSNLIFKSVDDPMYVKKSIENIIE